MASILQSRNRLENRRSKDDEMSIGVQEEMETRAREVRMAEAKEGGSQRRSWKKMRGERKEKAKEGEDGRSKKSSEELGNLG